jgi:hypothetical protein
MQHATFNHNRPQYNPPRHNTALHPSIHPLHYITLLLRTPKLLSQVPVLAVSRTVYGHGLSPFGFLSVPFLQDGLCKAHDDDDDDDDDDLDIKW